MLIEIYDKRESKGEEEEGKKKVADRETCSGHATN